MATFSLAYYEEYTFPVWADALGWMIGLFTLIPMPVFAVYSWKVGSIVSFLRMSGIRNLSFVILLQSFKKMFQPTLDWRPQNYKSDSKTNLATNEKLPI